MNSMRSWLLTGAADRSVRASEHLTAIPLDADWRYDRFSMAYPIAALLLDGTYLARCRFRSNRSRQQVESAVFDY